MGDCMRREIVRYVSKGFYEAYQKGDITEVGLVMASEKEKREYHFIPAFMCNWLNIPKIPIVIVIPELLGEVKK